MADVILVHGAGTGGWLWDDVAALLRAEGHQVLAPTLRGVGGATNDADRDVDLSTHIDAVTELANVDQFDRLTLVGFSYGGFVVTGAAAPARRPGHRGDLPGCVRPAARPEFLRPVAGTGAGGDAGQCERPR
jgi:pimeloyl-ACP methyl ester carboxylesterase